jgi:hypothetical protein
MIGRGADCDALVCAWARGFLCVECSLATHAGSSLLCTRGEEIVEHLREHQARGHRVTHEAFGVIRAG